MKFGMTEALVDSAPWGVGREGDFLLRPGVVQ